MKLAAKVNIDYSLHFSVADLTAATACCTVLVTALLKKLQTIQNAAACVKLVFHELHWLPVSHWSISSACDGTTVFS